jgi:hypothetical protein
MRKSSGVHVWVVEIDQRAGRGWEPLDGSFPTRQACRSVVSRMRKLFPKNHYRPVFYVRPNADSARQVVKR